MLYTWSVQHIESSFALGIHALFTRREACVYHRERLSNHIESSFALGIHALFTRREACVYHRERLSNRCYTPDPCAPAEYMPGSCVHL